MYKEIKRQGNCGHRLCLMNEFMLGIILSLVLLLYVCPAINSFIRDIKPAADTVSVSFSFLIFIFMAHLSVSFIFYKYRAMN
jgi:hypothetical protein